ncbi:MAG: acetolactate synthase small subunit [Rickettsiales bacterium]|mgnify:CR=1 FL=1|jgi:acetolactate synthase I/III small subunit|nr:acetolactate synthase small subunit [Rickettsiales bacterium]
MTDNLQKQDKHVVGILIDNEFGSLARVVNLFSARGYNIETLSVAVVDVKRNLSRITITTYGSPDVIDLIIKLLERLIPVHRVVDLSSGAHVERSLALVKIKASENESEIFRITEIHKAKLIEKTDSYLLFEIADTQDNIDRFVQLLEPFEIVEVSQTGSASLGLGRGNVLDYWKD